MIATVEVNHELIKRHEAERERKEKAERFESMFQTHYGQRPSTWTQQALSDEYEDLRRRAMSAKWLYEMCKEWDERYEEMKRKELGE